ncbi:zinc ribbon domain-containing protein [Oscillospiraceae bacterium PP1C4]
MICPNCGNSNQEHFQFCGQCGHVLYKKEIVENKFIPGKPRPNIAKRFAVGILILVIVKFLIQYGGMSQELLFGRKAFAPSGDSSTASASSLQTASQPIPDTAGAQNQTEDHSDRTDSFELEKQAIDQETMQRIIDYLSFYGAESVGFPPEFETIEDLDKSWIVESKYLLVDNRWDDIQGTHTNIKDIENIAMQSINPKIRLTTNDDYSKLFKEGSWFYMLDIDTGDFIWNSGHSGSIVSLAPLVTEVYKQGKLYYVTVLETIAIPENAWDEAISSEEDTYNYYVQDPETGLFSTLIGSATYYGEFEPNSELNTDIANFPTSQYVLEESEIDGFYLVSKTSR